MDISKIAQFEQMHLLRQKSDLLHKIEELPSGKLCIEKNGSRYKWFRIIRSQQSVSRKYLPKSDRTTAEQLALKQYLEAQLSLTEKQLRILQVFRDSYPNSSASTIQPGEGLSELLSGSPENKKHISERWMAEPYEKCEDHLESLKVPTKAGIFVRSKSEGIIADTLYENNIPFRYEQVLRLGDLKIFPDFTMLNPSDMQEVTIWEHFGMMDSPGYVSNAKLKINAYLDAHFLPGQNLILTYESKDKPLDSAYVSLLVSYHFS